MNISVIPNPNRSMVRFEEQSAFFSCNDETSLMNKSEYRGDITRKFSIPTQTGRNVAKVRWLQDRKTPLIPNPFATEHFVSGSWGDQNGEISLWTLNVDPDEYGHPAARIEALDKVSVLGNVTDMLSLSDELFVATNSCGSLILYKCAKNETGTIGSIGHVKTKNLHQIRSGVPVPARGVASNGASVVTVGEDGSIFESNAETLDTIHSLEKADSLSIYCVAFAGHSEILTGNGGGHLKLWDLRKKEKFPIHTMQPNIVMNNLYGSISIATHPSQNHLVIVGYQSGCMDLFDLRKGSGCDPIANLANDGGSISEIYFHQINPDHFFSCSQSGQLCQWYPGSGEFHQPLPLRDNFSSTPELNIEFLKRGLVFKQIYESPFPVNSLSVSVNDRIICGSDNGIVFCTEVAANI